MSQEETEGEPTDPVLRVVAALCQAVGGDRWPQALTELARYLDADAASALCREGGNPAFVAAGGPNQTLATRVAGAAGDGPGVLRPLLDEQPGQAMGVRATLGPDALCDNLRNLEDLDDMLGVAVASDDGHTAYVTAYRVGGRPPFGEVESTRLGLLLPHLRQAIGLHHRLATLSSAHEAALRALDRLPTPVAVVNREREIVAINDAARAIVAAGDGLLMRRGRLHPSSATAARDFQALIEDALDNHADAGTLALERPSLRRPLAVGAAPLSPTGRNDGAEAAVLMIADPESARRPSAEAIARLYGLTPSEARLAARLADGYSLADAAEALSVTRNTARTTLKKVFAKTGTRRQSELLRLVLFGTAVFHGDRADAD